MTTDDATRQWCVDATVVLRDAALAAGHLAAAVAVDWLDDHGRERAERIGALGRELADASVRADELARRLQDVDLDEPGLASTLVAALRAASLASGGGPRLGGTAGVRAGDGHGVHIAQLPDPPGY